MARYINADEYVIIPVVEKMDDEPSQLPITIGDLIKRTTKKEPIFADVREVILCKDCKYASPYWIEGTIFCVDSECPNFEDGFCNRAERGGE